MSTISELQATLSSATAAKSKAAGTVETQDRFLKLLVTQMQNQDPLNPMDNAQVTTQLAQLNTVDGINKLNDTMASMAASLGAQQALQATMLVGREVLVQGNRLAFGGQPAHFGVELPSDADRVSITIADKAGNIVDSIDAGPQPAGTLTLEWNGLNAAGQAMAPGDYVVSAQAFSGGKAIGVNALVGARVDSVGTGAGGQIELQLLGAGSIGIADIKRFL